MQPRLTRNTTDKMIAGVCAGLGEYFSIDPVIVRLIFVLVTLTSGLGLPVYILLWIIMPARTALPNNQTFQQGLQQFTQEASRFGQQAAQEAREFVVAQQRNAQTQQSRVDMPFAPPAAEYRFDPVTGQPIGPEGPATGQTVNLYNDPSLQPDPLAQTPPVPPVAQRRRNWNVLGLVLIGVGALVLLEQLNINMSLIFPLLLIIAGIVMIRRKR